MYDVDRLVGFKLNYAPTMWDIDEWCSPELWGAPPEKVCYFKCNTLEEEYRGKGLGNKLLTLSLDTVQLMGGTAGVAHIWVQSPGGSAVKYFTAAGGKMIKIHKDRWNEDSKKGYNCVIDGTDCHCQGAEMILYFEELKNNE